MDFTGIGLFLKDYAIRTALTLLMTRGLPMLESFILKLRENIVLDEKNPIGWDGVDDVLQIVVTTGERLARDAGVSTKVIEKFREKVL